MEKDYHYYVQFYKNFGWEIVTSQSFPVFVLYLVAVNLCGLWRKVARPLELKKLMFVYNLSLSLVNVFCFLGFVQSLRNAESLYEKKIDPFLSKVYYVYWITKIVELLDTVFMVLRHKFRQISPLHVYHHASMILLSEMGYSKYAWPAFSMPLMLNALVHVFLYLYYGLTAIGYQPSWKQRLTELQIIQFCIDMVHACYGFWHHNFCFWSLLYGFSMLYLFTTFYINAYVKKSTLQREKVKNK